MLSYILLTPSSVIKGGNNSLIVNNAELLWAAIENGCAISCAPAIETILLTDKKGKVNAITDRNYSKLARAPQSFYLNNIYDLHMKALAEGIDDFIDNCTMMNYYNKRLYMVETSSDNIKITTPNDYYIAKCIFERGDEIDG